jgi:hypothetical protein
MKSTISTPNKMAIARLLPGDGQCNRNHGGRNILVSASDRNRFAAAINHARGDGDANSLQQQR